MPKQLAFYFDSSSCSGCKACQIACKDRNQLEIGRLWRRVYEISGGGWQQQGHAWVSGVFAYHLSISCNHCQAPVCVEVCPTAAMTKRKDGIVVVDPGRCMGCQYCSWACPYGAPQFDQASGKMTKCNFCVDQLEAGLPPSCVAACPMRALDCGELDELKQRYPGVAEVHPLPGAHLTRPALLVKPHRDAAQAGDDSALVANSEEVGL